VIHKGWHESKSILIKLANWEDQINRTGWQKLDNEGMVIENESHEKIEIEKQKEEYKF